MRTTTSDLSGRTADGRGLRVRVRGDRIEAVDRGGPADPAEPLLLPGLVDLQLNGFAGHDANDPGQDDDELVAMVHRLWQHGVTTVLPTIISGGHSRTTAAIERIVRVRGRDADVAASVRGIHLEGPYLSDRDGARGAHDAAVLRDPDPDEFADWQEAARGRIAIVTLAPERAGAIAFTAAVSATGVICSMGHSLAETADVARFTAAGGRMSTHLGNGIPSQIDRHRNPVWPQLVEDALTAGLIADGHHLPPETFTALVRAKTPERCVLVSDAAALAGSPPGDYATPVGGSVTVGPSGELRVTGTDYLAGSGASLLDCLRNAAAWIGTGAAVRMATVQPADLLGDHDIGRLEPGARADLLRVTTDAEGRPAAVETVVVAGVPRVSDGRLL